VLLGAAALPAFREGPLPKMTGGFGETTCRTCHFDNALNDPAGSLTVDGLPAAWAPGRAYGITVAIRRAGVSRAGFEMTARFQAKPREGDQAGAFQTTDGRLQIIFAPGSPVQYIQHTKGGSLLATPGLGRWTFQWTAPSTAGFGPITFNVAANASNDDQSPLGDYVYTFERTIRPAAEPVHRIALGARAFGVEP